MDDAFLGVPPLLGRVFGAADAAPDAPPVAVMNHRAWMTLFDPNLPRGRHAFQARLRPGVTIEEAEAQLNVIAARRAAEHPEEYPPHSRMQVIGGLIGWSAGSGACWGDVLRMIFSMGLRLLGAGIVAGLAAGVATNRLLVSQLWNTSPHDPVTLVAAVSIILIIGTFACWVPAHRAIRVEPTVALRHE